MTVAGMHYTNSDQLFTYFLAGILEQGGSEHASKAQAAPQRPGATRTKFLAIESPSPTSREPSSDG
jgi:hypothetical protein